MELYRVCAPKFVDLTNSAATIHWRINPWSDTGVQHSTIPRITSSHLTLVPSTPQPERVDDVSIDYEMISLLQASAPILRIVHLRIHRFCYFLLDGSSLPYRKGNHEMRYFRQLTPGTTKNSKSVLRLLRSIATASFVGRHWVFTLHISIVPTHATDWSVGIAYQSTRLKNFGASLVSRWRTSIPLMS